MSPQEDFFSRHELALLRVSALSGLVMLGGMSGLFYTQMTGILSVSPTAAPPSSANALALACSSHQPPPASPVFFCPHRTPPPSRKWPIFPTTCESVGVRVRSRARLIHANPLDLSFLSQIELQEVLAVRAGGGLRDPLEALVAPPPQEQAAAAGQPLQPRPRVAGSPVSTNSPATTQCPHAFVLLQAEGGRDQGTTLSSRLPPESMLTRRIFPSLCSRDPLRLFTHL